jgi:hypothetical protein
MGFAIVIAYPILHKQDFTISIKEGTEGYHFVRPYGTSVACKMVGKENLPYGNGKNAEDTDLSG